MGYRALFNENRELKTQLALLRDVLENIGSCVYAKDLDGRYIYANTKSCELLGASMEEIIGADDSKFFLAATAAQISKNERAVLDSGQTQIFKLTAETKATSHPKSILATKAPLRNNRGQLIGVCGVVSVILPWPEGTQLF